MEIGWISTDLLIQVLRVKNEDGTKSVWNGTPDAIVANAEWFFPCLERFIWGVSSTGYGLLPEEVRRQMVEDVPRWSTVIQQQAERCGYRYVDMADNFAERSSEAETILTGSE